MYRLHGFFTQNTMKPLYVLEELGIDGAVIYAGNDVVLKAKILPGQQVV